MVSSSKNTLVSASEFSNLSRHQFFLLLAYNFLRRRPFRHYFIYPQILLIRSDDGGCPWKFFRNDDLFN